MTENMKIAIEAVNKWFYFTQNFEMAHYSWTRAGWVPCENPQDDICDRFLPEFIFKVRWTCGPDHIVDKWEAAVTCAGWRGAPLHFYGALDNTNRVALIEYVMANYNQDLKII